jgi:hypothetical protein
VNQALNGEFDYETVLKISADNVDALSDLKVCLTLGYWVEVRGVKLRNGAVLCIAVVGNGCAELCCVELLS